METIRVRFEKAIKMIDEANAEDPHTEYYDGKEYPKELLYSLRMTEWLQKIEPQSSEAAKLAARCQHIQRWKIPREGYPMDRKGYHLWRTKLKKFHADKAEAVLSEVGYEQDLIDRVRALLLKEKLKTDPEVQLLEDVICLVFLQYYFSEFAKKYEEDKLVDIVRKTWKKMSPKGHHEALKLDLPPQEGKVVERALKDEK